MIFESTRLIEEETIAMLSHEDILDVLEGLSYPQKSLPSKLFYDSKGSNLFDRIMELDEYYLTNCEFEILSEQADSFAESIGDKPFNLIELGAGDGRKTSVLLESFLQKKLNFEYVPIDISSTAMETLADNLRTKFGNTELKVKGITAEYFSALKWISSQNSNRNVLLFLGSNIGNFTYKETNDFLRHLWYSLNPDDLVVIGFDLKKDPEVITAAYTDSKGVTQEFNLNLLDRLNREMGANFDRSKFIHHGFYNAENGACQSYLISTCEQSVDVKALDRRFDFKAWEGILTEHSHKYLISEIESLAKNAGFIVKEHLSDSQHYFVDSIWKVEKQAF